MNAGIEDAEEHTDEAKREAELPVPPAAIMGGDEFVFFDADVLSKNLPPTVLQSAGLAGNTNTNTNTTKGEARASNVKSKTTMPTKAKAGKKAAKKPASSKGDIRKTVGVVKTNDAECGNMAIKKERIQETLVDNAAEEFREETTTKNAKNVASETDWVYTAPEMKLPSDAVVGLHDDPLAPASPPTSTISSSPEPLDLPDSQASDAEILGTNAIGTGQQLEHGELAQIYPTQPAVNQADDGSSSDSDESFEPLSSADLRGYSSHNHTYDNNTEYDNRDFVGRHREHPDGLATPWVPVDGDLASARNGDPSVGELATIAYRIGQRKVQYAYDGGMQAYRRARDVGRDVAGNPIMGALGRFAVQRGGQAWGYVRRVAVDQIREAKRVLDSLEDIGSSTL